MEEDALFTFPEFEENEDETQHVVRIFRMVTGSSLFDVSYVESIKRELKEVSAPSKIDSVISILKYHVQNYEKVSKDISELISKMKKEKKDEILADLDVLRDMEQNRKAALDGISKIQGYFSEFLERYSEFLKEKEDVLNARMEEFEKEVERRKIQAKMLVEKEKELLEREHKLRERERAIEREISEMQIPQGEGGEISKEEWMEQQKRIQEKLYKLREEVVKKTGESEKEKLTKEVLKILDELLGHLPDEIIEEFATSRNFELYKKVMEMYGLGGASGSA